MNACDHISAGYEIRERVGRQRAPPLYVHYYGERREIALESKMFGAQGEDETERDSDCDAAHTDVAKLENCEEEVSSGEVPVCLGEAIYRSVHDNCDGVIEYGLAEHHIEELVVDLEALENGNGGHRIDGRYQRAEEPAFNNREVDNWRGTHDHCEQRDYDGRDERAANREDENCTNVAEEE